MARRTKDDAQKTRNAILDAAEKIFYAHGVTRSSLEQIAESASVTRGAVYWHFKDKPALVEAMAQRVFLPHEDMLEKLAAQPSDKPLEDLKKSCLHALRMMAKDKRRREVVTILFQRCEYTQEMLDIVKRRNTCKNRMLALSEKLFFHAKALKMLAPCWTPRQAAVATQALMTGLILGGLENRKNVGFAKVGIPCVEAFFNSLHVN
jgi:AcrR family transcriptional regulator